ncbi:MAG: hypothetical protein WCK01_02135 [Candidatus Uhrbacteria bacterium]
MTPKQARDRGRMVTTVFIVFGLIGWWFSPDWIQSLPLALMYAMLMLQTWCSLPLFFQLINENDIRQRLIDPMIGIAYGVLAFGIRDSFFFFFVWSVFFAMTVLKYSMLVGSFPNTTLLRRKLMANALGVSLGLLSLILVGYDSRFAWIGTGLFAGACVQYLVVRPLYVRDKV